MIPFCCLSTKKSYSHSTNHQIAKSPYQKQDLYSTVFISKYNEHTGG